MRIVLFAHSVLSDWNHGNAHFLRGVVTELCERGHDVRCFEAIDAWSVENLVRDHGEAPIAEVRRAYPRLSVTRYDPSSLDLDRALEDADLVWVHEWNEPWLVGEIGARRKRGARFRALFHDTHHRAVSAPHELERFDLSGYDGVLAFGAAIARIYEQRGWGARAWTWHEAADVRVFGPRDEGAPIEGHLVWIGNYGDGERAEELREYLIDPVRALGLSARVYGVRYPDEARHALGSAGILYGGWLANHRAPSVFARHRATVHIPRRFYARELRGIPTIRPFEALACGAPMVSAWWDDAEGLFRPGRDYLVVEDGAQMTEALRAIMADADLRADLAKSGRETILARHTCAHRADELLAICRSIGIGDPSVAGVPTGSGERCASRSSHRAS